jgi:hypothetical protein
VKRLESRKHTAGNFGVSIVEEESSSNDGENRDGKFVLE